MSTYIVAEIGSNWTSFEDCMESVVKAKQSGADAVKFQLYSRLELYGSGRAPRKKDAIDIAIDEIFPAFKDPVNDYALQSDWLPKIAEKAKASGIDFMCTGFSSEGYDLINPLVTRHKIASSEMCHVRILQKVNSFKKPVYLSTGAQTEADIRQALTYLPDCEVTLMYCEASYPAKWVDFLAMIGKFGGSLDLLQLSPTSQVGFSDHTTSIIEIPRRFGAQATAYEKHFKIRDMETPDSPHSLLPDEFKVMVSAIRGDYETKIGPTPDEGDMILKHKRRLIATRDIKAGDAFVEGQNFGIYRSLISDTKALSPFAVDHVNGKSAKIDINAGEGISPDAI